MRRPTLCLIVPVALVLVLILIFSQSQSSFHPKDYICSYQTPPPETSHPTNLDENVALPDPGPIHKNVAIYMLVPPSRLHQATIALRSTENAFNRRLKYPYVLLMSEEELPQVSEEMKGKIDWITEGRATFATLRSDDWNIPENLDKGRIENSLKTIGFSSAYRLMCRFNSGLFYRHPALSKYDWLWRLDTDIVFHCDVPYDPIQRMIDANALYGFVQISGDAEYVQPSLATNVSQFLATHSGILPQDANLGFVWRSPESIEKALKGQGTNADWNRMCMYNNFELSHRSVWESEVYQSFFEFLDEAGGFFYERWGDAPVHSFGVSMALRKDQVLQFNDMGYQHQGWPYECPETSPRCTCKKEGAAAKFRDGRERWFDAPEYRRSESE